MQQEVAHHIDHLHARNLRPTYIESRVRLLDRLERHLGAAPSTASLDDLRSYLDRPLGPGSRATEIAHLKAFFRWAVTEELLDRDPTVRLEKPKLPAAKPRPIATSDLVVALRAADDLIRPMLLLAAYAGLRACEIAPLRGEHVLLDDDPPVLIVVEGKGGAPGSVPLAPVLAAELATLPRRGLLFPRIDGRPGPMSRYRVCQLCNGHLHSLGIEATAHQCRHWFLTETYRATHDLRLTQRLARHRSSTTTDRYTYLSDTEATRAVGMLPAL